jgi:tRNA pseudouridine55 synthase
MAKRRGRKVDGWLNLDKPVGLSSAQAVARARRLFGAAKVGHGGTLDPLASGVLPIAFGEATKTVAWVMEGPKEYRFTLRLGVATATDDSEGAVIATADARPTDAALVAALSRFRGDIVQRPPAYSALKVAGRRAYALARAGEVVDLDARRVTVFDIKLLERTDRDNIILWVRCGKGTYIRALARDIAQALGTVGHVAMLRRTACGPFREADAVTLEELGSAGVQAAPVSARRTDAGRLPALAEAANPLSPPPELGHTSALFGYLRPVATALDDIPALALTADQAQRIARGLAIPLAEVRNPDAAPLPRSGVVAAFDAGRLVAIAMAEGPLLRPVRVFNL